MGKRALLNLTKDDVPHDAQGDSVEQVGNEDSPSKIGGALTELSAGERDPGLVPVAETRSPI